MPTSLLILKEQQRNGKEAICQILLNRFKILEAVVKLHQRVQNQNHTIVKLAWTHFPKIPSPCSQDSSILEPQYCESKEFIIQGPIHLETNTIPEQQDLNLPAVTKDSSNGNNSIKSQDAEFCKKKDSREKDQASPSNKEFFLSECEEVPFINQDV
ncbi:hypothetical protein NC651_016394 [Populus alba x Populus x berolinensis]|nr:hypothetical protein NC651_016394 [Populus alba x Populus x berolinensis]